MFTKEKVNLINEDIKKALCGVEEKHNIKINYSGKYNIAEFNVSLRVIFKNLNDRAKSMEKECEMLGLPKDLIGKTFDNGKSVIIDIKLRNRKYPVIYQKDGKNYKTTIEQINRYLNMGVLK